MAINFEYGSFSKPVESSDKQDKNDKQDNSRLHNVDMQALMSNVKSGPNFTKDLQKPVKDEKVITDQYFAEELMPTFNKGLSSFKENNANMAAVNAIKENSKAAKIYESDEAFRKAFGIEEKATTKPTLQLANKQDTVPGQVDMTNRLPSLQNMVKVSTVKDRPATGVNIDASEKGAENSQASKQVLEDRKSRDRSADASKMLAGKEAATQAEKDYKAFESTVKDGKFKGSVEKVGDTTIYKNENGVEVFRRQGDVATITKDGIRYSFNDKTGVKEVRGQDGKLEVRVFKNGIVETPDGAGNTIRLDAKNNRLAIVGADGKIVSELTDIKGHVKGNIKTLQYEKLDEMPKKNDPKALAEQMERLFNEGKQGQITFKDGSVAYLNEKRDKDGKLLGRFFTFVSLDGTMASRAKDGTVMHRTADGQVSIVTPQGEVRKATEQQLAVLRARFTPKDLNNTLAAFGMVAEDGTTTTVTGNTTRVENNEARITQTAQGTVIFEDKESGTSINHNPSTPGFKVSTADGRTVKSGRNGVSIETKSGRPILVDTNGTITDTRNGTVLDNKGMRTADGINYDSRTGSTSFGNGDVLDSHGVLRSGDSLSHGAKDSTEMAMEAKAHSAVASAESIASSILAKAASGRVSSGDIAALNSVISGLEVNIKALSDETDPSAMIRLMMAKESVSSSRDRAQDTANLQKDGKAPLGMVA